MNDPVTRRTFVASMGMAMAAAPALLAQTKNRDKREALLSLRKGGSGPDYVPAAFFVHFDRNFHFGPAAVERHLEYFRFTGMDFLKIQYERSLPEPAGHPKGRRLAVHATPRTRLLQTAA